MFSIPGDKEIKFWLITKVFGYHFVQYFYDCNMVFGLCFCLLYLQLCCSAIKWFSVYINWNYVFISLHQKLCCHRNTDLMLLIFEQINNENNLLAFVRWICSFLSFLSSLSVLFVSTAPLPDWTNVHLISLSQENLLRIVSADPASQFTAWMITCFCNHIL